MSPSRFSAGMTSGSPDDEIRSANVASISCGSYGDVGMARRRGVHLLLQHSLVRRADRVLRPAEHLRAGARGLPERELGDGVADAPLDALGAERDLVVALALAPLGRAVRVADRHAHDRDRREDAADRHDARDPAARADDHLAADLLAEDPVRRADVVAALGRDRRRLEAEPVLADRRGRLVHDLVLRRAAAVEREVEAEELEREADHVRRENAERLLEQLLPGLVPLEDDDRGVVSHRVGSVDAAWGGLGEGARAAFRYYDARGRQVVDAAQVERIERLAIPPAWQDVWISPSARAKLQATGRDKAGRKQYLYHPDFRAAQEQAKYDNLIRFAEKLPELRATMAEHLDKDGLDRERVSAIALRLINLGWFRVGSERYARESRTYGITTLTQRHVTVRGHRIALAFRGKHKIQVRTTLVDEELAAAMKELLGRRRARASSSTSGRAASTT